MQIMPKKYFILFALCFIISGCVSTEGEIDIKGKTLDEATKTVTPNRKVIVEAILNNESENKKINAGQFYSDSLGNFSYTLKKVKGAYFYNFQFVGDSAYASSSKCFGLGEIANNSKFIFFYLNKLSKLTINVTRTRKSLPEATLYLSWKSDGIEGKSIYQYKVSNFGAAPEFDFKWSSNNVNSKIETRVLADKPTIINWEIRNGQKKQEIIDTIVCKRDITNYVKFTY